MLLFIITSFFLQFKGYFLSQDNTGNPGNCGPTSLAMAYNWVVEENEYTVEEMREAIGLRHKDGSTPVHDILRFLNNNDIFYRTHYDYYEDHPSIILIDTTPLRNKNYPYNSGHYVFYLGEYDIDPDFVVVHDPKGGPFIFYHKEDFDKAFRFQIVIFKENMIEKP